MSNQIASTDYQSIVASATNVIFCFDRNFQIFEWNPAAENFYNSSRQEVLEKNYINLFLDEAIQKSFADHMKKVFQGNSVNNFEIPFQPQAGQKKSLHLNFTCLRDQKNQPYGVAAIGQDITEKKQSEKALKEILEGTASTTGKSFFDELVRHLSLALDVQYVMISKIISQDPPRVRVIAMWCDGEHAKPFEYDLDETPCQYVYNNKVTFYPKDVQKIFPKDLDLVTLNAQSYLGVPLTDGTGHAMGNLCVLDVKPITDDKYARTILQIFASRALAEFERKNFEDSLLAANKQLQQTNEELNEFTRAASHDLKEPLRKIMVFTDLLKSDLESKSFADLNSIFDGLFNSVSKMSKLIESLLVHSYANEKEFGWEKISLKECVHEVLNALSLQINESKAQIIVGDLPEVWGYKVLLTQLYQNLIDNSLKYVGSKLPVIELTAQVDQEDLILGVRDNGIGIEPRFHKKIFIPFKRLHSYDDYKGSGIGLATCQKIIHRHGGKIWVESDLNQGAHFKFTLKKVENNSKTNDFDKNCQQR